MAFTAKPKDADGWAESAPIKDVGGKGAPEAPVSVANPDAPYTKTFNLRMNEYALGLLTRVAKLQRRSKQSAAQEILVPALERAVVELEQSRAGAGLALRKSRCSSIQEPRSRELGWDEGEG